MSFRNPPEKSHEERAGQARGRLRGVLESRLASQRKFFTGPAAGPSPSSSQGPEVPDDQVSSTAAAGGPPESQQAQSPVSEAMAPFEHAKSSKESPPVTESRQEGAPSEALDPQIQGEESSVTTAAPAEEIKFPAAHQPAAAAKTRPAESSRYHGLERRGSFRYKVARIEVLFGWRQGASAVSTGAAGMVEERTVNHPSGIGLAGYGSGGVGPKAMRGLEATSLPADFDHHEARVHDVSQTGLCLIVDRLPPDNRDLWIGLKGTLPVVWSRVVLRSLSEPYPGCFMLRLSFKESCPYDLFKLAVTHKGDTRAAT
ncbi:MAG: hypothetical protein ACLP7Q_00930 [Isosphaeraceae bacterium]